MIDALQVHRLFGAREFASRFACLFRESRNLK